MGFVDDWSYARTAQVFAETGHFAYNGWATAMLGWQVVWGALFIKLFGFSFVILRVSMLPVAMASVFLFHEVLRGFGVNPQNAVIGTLTLGLSPLFMPLADSFMTDIPGLLVILICLYCCQRAIASSGTGAAIVWLAVAAATNVAGGTVRQISWLGALVMIPSAGWMLRRRRGVVQVTLVLWLASVASIVLCMRWFARQPYSAPDPVSGLLFGDVPVAALAITINLTLCLMCLLLLLIPVLVAWTAAVRGLSGHGIGKLTLILVACTVLQIFGPFSMPWMGHVIQSALARYRPIGFAIPAPDSFFLPLWPRALVGSATIGTGLLLAIDLRNWLRNQHAGSLRQIVSRKEVVLTAPFAASYFLLLCPRAAEGVVFDRYLLGVLPVLLVWLLLFFQSRRGGVLPRSCVALLAVFALLGIAGTHNWFAWQRARGEAINEVLASGVPRSEIQGGFEPDGWTQVLHGYINDARVLLPANSFHKFDGNEGVPADCQMDFASRTPYIRPRFTVGFDPRWCFAPTNYPPIRYTRWLPPFRGTIYVQQIVRK